MFKIKKILYVLFIVLLFASCLPQKMVYKPSNNILIINDFAVVMVNNGDLLYNGNFHYSVSFSVNNKSHSLIYIDSLSCKMVSIYEDTTTLYVRSYLSDNIISPNSEKKVYIAFNEKDTSIVSDYLSNRKKLKKNHQFVMDLHLIVEDSIVSKKIVFTPAHP